MDVEGDPPAGVATRGEQLPLEKGWLGERCPVEMLGAKRCGRAIHPAPGHDRIPVCLMHSRDPGKSDQEFQKKFEAILEAAEDDVANFSGYVFPSSNYNEREFKARCLFADATFTQAAEFNQARFLKGAWFANVTFTQEADFSRSEFKEESGFCSANFKDRGSFRGSTFEQDVDFTTATFAEYADFTDAKFMREGTFFFAMFVQDADFSWATFTQGSNFNHAIFTRETDFHRATFSEYASIVDTTFTQDVNFEEATFEQGADFSTSKFAQDVLFHRCVLWGKVSFRGARFVGRVEFRETTFRQDQKLEPGPIFSLAEFAQPERVIFYRTYLGQALFYNCDVSKLNFSSVDWRQRKSGGKRVVFEEEVDLGADDAQALGPTVSLDDRHYSLIAELYQQLKKNFDERKDYWTAGDFHYGEMEMKRLATKTPGRLVRLIGGKILGEHRLNTGRRWWHRHLSLVAWYKYASQYGESYARPLLCLALVLLLFTFLFPIVGLDWNDTMSAPSGTSVTQQTSSQTANNELNYGHFSDFVRAYKGRKWLARPAFFGNSLMTTLSVAGFQKELRYEPSYPWGRALALLELLLTSTLAALFLLAVRRQFRR